MVAMILRILLVEFVVFLLINMSDSSEHRSKRFLTFPRTSPTRLQMIIGIGIPVELEIESVTVGWVQKSEFFLPENASNYLNFLFDPFDLTTRPFDGFYVRKRREGMNTRGTDSVSGEEKIAEEPKPTENPRKIAQDSEGYDSDEHEQYEKHQVEAEVVESGTESEADADELTDADYWNQEDRAEWLNKLKPKQPRNLGMVRWGIYKSMAILSQAQGLVGRSCVLRAICESAHASFDHSNGILGELMHIVMTPSLTKDEVKEHEDYEYFHAEKLGNDGAPCEHVFKECQMSILDQFSGIYTPMLDLLRNLSV